MIIFIRRHPHTISLLILTVPDVDGHGVGAVLAAAVPPDLADERDGLGLRSHGGDPLGRGRPARHPGPPAHIVGQLLDPQAVQQVASGGLDLQRNNGKI